MGIAKNMDCHDMCKDNKFKDDQMGQAFTLDIMLALIIIAVIMGISADTMEIAGNKVNAYPARFSLERVTVDAADMLVKTPGSPDNWESSIGNSTTPGLAEIVPQTKKVVANTLSMGKINALSRNYNSLIYGKVLPWGVNSSLTIYPSDPSLNPIEIIKNDPKNAVEVAVAKRTVTLDLFDIKAVVNKDNKNKLICPHLDHSSCGWACQNFNITASELNSTDFYLVTDPSNMGDSASWVLDRPEKGLDNGSEEKFSSTPINLNQKISNLMGNDNKGVLWFHLKIPGRNFDAYILSVPKGTSPSHVNLNSVNAEPWFLVLQVWY